MYFYDGIKVCERSRLMLNENLEILLKELGDKEFHTANKIAKKLNVSEKTIRIRMKELNHTLNSQGALIESRQNMGYRIKILDEVKFLAFCNLLEEGEKEKIPTTSAERVSYILAFLLNQTDYIKLEDLCDFLYVSRNTITADLKKAEYILNIYHLTLQRKPNYGIMIFGKEFDKRICIARSLIKHNSIIKKDGKKQLELQMIGDIIMEVIYKYKMRISEISLESLINHAYIAVGRIRRNHQIEIDNDKINKLVREEAMKAALDIVSIIEAKIHVSFGEDEISYLALHFGAKLSSNSYHKYGTNMVISGEIDELVLQMLDIIYHSFKIDFRNNLELRMSLNQHMVPFDIRMQYNIPLKNPLIQDIKKEYALAYTMAATACIALSNHYKTSIPEDEIGYFALLFALTIEKQDKKVNKKNIVIVCASGKGTTQLFMYKYKQAFGKYINNIYECSAYELENFDFKDKEIDYVFTTIPIHVSVPVPVFEVNLFLEHHDIAIYSELFEMGSNEFLNKYYKKSLFLTDISADTKEDIIKQLCDHTSQYYELPDNFYEAVIKREKLGQTDFGNLIAIPHPFQVITKENFVTVGILKEPFWWGHNEVQVVFLIAISTEADADIERFYKLTTKFLFNAEYIQYLIDNPSFEVLFHLLSTGIKEESE
jgi:lichenan operon transcriptional antiterminator